MPTLWQSSMWVCLPSPCPTPIPLSKCFHTYRRMMYSQTRIHTLTFCLFYSHQIQSIHCVPGPPCDCNVVHTLQTPVPQRLCSVHHKGVCVLVCLSTVHLLVFLLLMIFNSQIHFLNSSVTHTNNVHMTQKKEKEFDMGISVINVLSPHTH